MLLDALRPIRSDDKLAVSISTIDGLLDQTTLALDEQDYSTCWAGSWRTTRTSTSMYAACAPSCT